MGGIVVPWLAEMIIITIRDLKKGSTNNVAGLPLPADYLASFAIFGVLGALPESANTFAAVTGWGFVIATFLNLVDPTLNKAGQPNGTAPAATASTATPPPGSVAPASTPAAQTAA